jgi:hypothetical protein
MLLLRDPWRLALSTPHSAHFSAILRDPVEMATFPFSISMPAARQLSP